MKKSVLLKLSTVLSFLILLSACNRGLKFYDQDMQADFRWSNQEIKKIQFYLSEDIYLWRKLKAEDARIKNGKIRIIDDSKVEEVIIAKNTPGVVIFIPKRNKLAVSFDNDDELFLMFGPNPKRGNKYVLLAKDWEKRIGKVTYGGQVYNTSSESAFAGLLVDIKEAKNVNYSSKKASGRKVRG